MEPKSNMRFEFEVHSNHHVLRYEFDDCMCKLLPNWTQKIKDCHMIQIENVDDFVGIYEFFEGIRTNHIKLTKDNFETISKLSTLSGFRLTDYISESKITDSNLAEVLTNYCLFFNDKKNQSHDLSTVENILAEHYYKNTISIWDISKPPNGKASIKLKYHDLKCMETFYKYILIDFTKIKPDISISFFLTCNQIYLINSYSFNTLIPT